MTVQTVALQQWLYRLYAEDGTLLYVGVTQCGQERFAEHRKSKPWWPQVASHTIQVYESRTDVLLAERHAIYREKPLHNVVHASTGRRLFGPDPIPSSEPLTWEAQQRRARERIRAALNGPPPRAACPVFSLADARARQAQRLASSPQPPTGGTR